MLWKGSTTIGVETDDENKIMSRDSPTICIKMDDEDMAVSKQWGLLAAKERLFREIGIYGNAVTLESGGL